ncbi:acyl-CoA thioesterase [Rhizobium sp. PAMB 3174]
MDVSADKSAAPAHADIRLEDFPFRAYDKLRFGDTDRQGHVNNAVFATFMETGRVEAIFNPQDPMTDAACSFVLAKLDLDYRAEVHWPGTVDIGTRIVAVGRSSVRMEQAVFQNGRCAAFATTVVVQMNHETRRSQAFSDRTRARLTEIAAP